MINKKKIKICSLCGSQIKKLKHSSICKCSNRLRTIKAIVQAENKHRLAKLS